MKRVISKFALPSKFIEQYKQRPHRFGFGVLGEIAYSNSYSRLKEDGYKEVWHETVERVVNGTFSMLVNHLNEQKITHFAEEDLMQLATEMYDKIFNFKFLPPGRGLWAMGTKVINDKKLFAALNNCSFVSTELKGENISQPFAFAHDMLMLGTGVGFDTKLAKEGVVVQSPLKDKTIPYKIEDSREGFVDSTKLLLDSYFFGYPTIELDYSAIRPKGTPIKGFGGTAPGPEPLKVLHKEIKELLDKKVGQSVNTRTIVDLMNLIAKSVISGNVRRSSLAAFGEFDDEEFSELKNYEKYPERAKYGWTSNNSIYATLGMEYNEIVPNIKRNGEPGIVWLENMQKYGRMVDPPNFKDYRATGGNPCLEQTLESYELCCLVEVFPFRHSSLEEFRSTLQSALLYAKVVTLGLPHWEESKEIVKRNRRIGCSLSGIAQFLSANSLHTLKEWCDSGYKQLQEYDSYLSKVLKVPKSIKLTSIKPSGTVSLLAGATAGIHYPDYRTYLRRVRISSKGELADYLRNKGYNVEKDAICDNTEVVDIPIKWGEGMKIAKEQSMWEQMNLVAFMQKYWADNQISCTVKIKEDDKVAEALDFFQYQLKGISFLPIKGKAYAQSPIEEITEDTYAELVKKLKRNGIREVLKEEKEDAKPEMACETDRCILNGNTQK